MELNVFSRMRKEMEVRMGNDRNQGKKIDAPTQK